MGRWIALGLTLLCFSACSLVSPNPMRGIVAPLMGLLMGMVTAWLFIADRVSQNTRSDSALLQDPETLRLLRERAARNAAAKAPSPPAAAQAQQPQVLRPAPTARPPEPPAGQS